MMKTTLSTKTSSSIRWARSGTSAPVLRTEACWPPATTNSTSDTQQPEDVRGGPHSTESLSSQWPRSRPFGVHMHLSVTTHTATCPGHSEWFLVKRKIRLRSGVSVRRVQQSISRGRKAEGLTTDGHSVSVWGAVSCWRGPQHQCISICLPSTQQTSSASDSKVLTCAAVWRMPKELEPGSHESPDDSSSTAHTLELLCHLDNTAHGSMACVTWEPTGDGKRVISLADNHILLWDLQESSSQAVLASSASLEGKGQLKFTSGRWSPHHTGTQVATANDTTIRGWDTRSMSQIYCIENAHGQLVRDLDFNPNKQYYLASCGDDCKVKFWDTRNVTEPVKTLEEHSHWVWNVRYNHSHDQLVLTGSSDSRVILTNMVSISSEPFGHLVDDDDLSDQEERRPEEKKGDSNLLPWDPPRSEASVHGARPGECRVRGG
uniref:EARP and GARP complex-interacting protein 1 n=1 Tax=Canis lupus familiaris TaxID=9615 RepID=A0A8C0SNZ2_CANLF